MFQHESRFALIGREGQAHPYMRIMYIMLNYGYRQDSRSQDRLLIARIQT
jgi:hypothetical protein